MPEATTLAGPVETPELSAVIPCLNEGENVDAICAAVAAELQQVTPAWEILFIDNGSTDQTVELVKRICADEPRVRLIVNNKNYGQLRSPTHAIFQARGKAVIGICADFQDPPEMIGQFVALWRGGAKTVLAVRQSEKSPVLVTIMRSAGYRLLNWLADYPIIPNATGFGLYDREVVDALAAWSEPEPFFRGMLVESGFPIATIPYHRPERAGGRTKNNLLTGLDFALTGLASSSKGLLRAPLYLSLLVFAAACLTIILAVGLALSRQRPWGVLALAAMELLFGVTLFSVGLVGDQVRLISERTRGRPLVIEKERVNF